MPVHAAADMPQPAKPADSASAAIAATISAATAESPAEAAGSTPTSTASDSAAAAAEKSVASDTAPTATTTATIAETDRPADAGVDTSSLTSTVETPAEGMHEEPAALEKTTTEDNMSEEAPSKADSNMMQVDDATPSESLDTHSETKKNEESHASSTKVKEQTPEPTPEPTPESTPERDGTIPDTPPRLVSKLIVKDESPKKPELDFSDEINKFPPGARVWAKVKGFPYWPARVESESDIPDNILALKPKVLTAKAAKSVPLFFYGTRDFCWLPCDELKDFLKFENELAKKSKQPTFLKAVKEALSPNHTQIQFRKKYKKSTEKVDNEDGNDESESESNPAPKPEKKKPGRRKSTPVESEKSKMLVDDDDEEGAGAVESEKKKSRKRRVTDGGEAMSKKKRAIDYSDDEENTSSDKKASAVINGKSSEAKEKTSGIDKEKEKDKEPKSQEEKLKKLRNKLQRFLQEAHTEPDHFAKANKYMTDVENFEVDAIMLMNTKIGKVIKRITHMELETDEYNLVSRSKAIMQKWHEFLGKPEDN